MSAEPVRFVRLDHYLAASPRNGYSPVESSDWTGVQMLGLGCLTFDGFAPRQLKNAPSSVSEKHVAILRDGDILMSRANTRDLVGLAGRYSTTGTPCIYPDLMMRLRPADNCIPEFLEFLLRARSVRQSIQNSAQGTSESMVKISARSVCSLMVPNFSLEEQRRIVEVLDAASESERAAQAAIAKLRTLRSSFVENRISAADHWGPLGDRLRRIDAGRSPNLPGTPASPGEWGVLKVSAINEMGFRPSENKRVSDPALIDERCEALQGDLIIARASTANLVGRTCRVTGSPYRLLLSDKTLRVVMNPDEAIRQYVDICFGSSRIRRQVEGMSSGISQGMQNITQGAIVKILVPWVDVDLQRTFVAHVESIDDRIRAEVSSAERTRDLQEALVSSLLARSREEAL